MSLYDESPIDVALIVTIIWRFCCEAIMIVAREQDLKSSSDLSQNNPHGDFTVISKCVFTV